MGPQWCVMVQEIAQMESRATAVAAAEETVVQRRESLQAQATRRRRDSEAALRRLQARSLLAQYTPCSHIAVKPFLQ